MIVGAGDRRIVGERRLLQIRNVPDDLHRSLKERAARDGTTLSDLILGELPRLARRPSPDELLERVRARSPVPGAPASELIAAERQRR